MFDQHIIFLYKHFDHNVNHYISDLQTQISKFNEQLTEKEKKTLQKGDMKQIQFKDDLLEFEAELRSFSFK